jgi:predicted lactoylglutathione lyase
MVSSGNNLNPGGIMNTRIAGIVLRASNRHITAEFYKKLGLNTNEHEHGGPKHYEIGPLSKENVVEIYQQSTTFTRDAIMLEVDSIDSAITAVSDLGIKPKGEVKDSVSMRFVYITDPDGRDVMLIENK